MGGGKASQQLRRVLIVDDDADTARTLAALLEDMGHEAAYVTRSTEALPRAKSFRPHIAFVDLGMPQVDGHALARSFRADAELQNISLVAISGHGEPEDRARSRQAGFDAHLVKPADAALIEAILTQFQPK